MWGGGGGRLVFQGRKGLELNRGCMETADPQTAHSLPAGGARGQLGTQASTRETDPGPSLIRLPHPSYIMKRERQRQLHHPLLSLLQPKPQTSLSVAPPLAKKGPSPGPPRWRWTAWLRTRTGVLPGAHGEGAHVLGQKVAGRAAPGALLHFLL